MGNIFHVTIAGKSCLDHASMVERMESSAAQAVSEKVFVKNIIYYVLYCDLLPRIMAMWGTDSLKWDG